MTTMRLYHTTTREEARRIMTTGFRDGLCPFGNLEGDPEGVYLTTGPENAADGFPGDWEIVLAVDFRHEPTPAVAQIWWFDQNPEYRYYLVPAEFVNHNADVLVFRDDFEPWRRTADGSPEPIPEAEWPEPLTMYAGEDAVLDALDILNQPR